MKKSQFSSRKGFTLIELMVVISIISMLSSVVLASLNGARAKAVVGRGLTFSNHIRSALYDDGSLALSFNDASGTTVKDDWSSNVVNMNNSTFLIDDTPSGSGKSIFFNGATSGTFATPITMTSATTISFWVKIIGNPPSGVIFSSLCGGGPIYLAIQDSGNNNILYVYTNSSVAQRDLVSNGSVNDGKWHHLVWSNNGSNQSTIYIDGVIDKQNVTHGSPRSPFTRASYLGRRGCDPEGSPQNTSVDDLRIYKKQLAASEIQQIYAEGVRRLRLAENQ